MHYPIKIFRKNDNKGIIPILSNLLLYVNSMMKYYVKGMMKFSLLRCIFNSIFILHNFNDLKYHVDETFD